MPPRKFTLVVDNRTHWDTRSLRRLFLRGLRAQEAHTKRRAVTVRVRYSRSGGRVSGHAYVGSASLQLNLPGPGWVRNGGLLPRTKTIAQVFVHEVQHMLGLEHRDMVDCFRFPVAWAEGIEVEWKEPAPVRVARSERVSARAEHAAAMLRRAETRLKRAKTIRDKWARKVKYYAKRGEEFTEI